MNQTEMFPDGEDLPIFSGAPVRKEVQPFKLKEEHRQGALIDMRPTNRIYRKENKMTTLQIPRNLRREIAERMVRQSHPGFDPDEYGQWYVIDTDGDNELDHLHLMWKASAAPWNPWDDKAVAVPVTALYRDSLCDFDPTPNFDLMDESYAGDKDAYDLAAWQAAVDLAEAELPDEYTIPE